MNPARLRAQAAARAGLDAHMRLVTARALRRAALDLSDMGQHAEAETVRRVALKLDRERRALMRDGAAPSN